MKKNQISFNDQLFLTVTQAYLTADRANPNGMNARAQIQMDAETISKYVEALILEKTKLDEKLNPPKVKTDEVAQ